MKKATPHTNERQLQQDYLTKCVVDELQHRHPDCPSCKKMLQEASQVGSIGHIEDLNLFYLLCVDCTANQNPIRIRKEVEKNPERYIIKQISNLPESEKIEVHQIEHGEWTVDDAEFFEANVDRSFRLRPVFEGESNGKNANAMLVRRVDETFLARSTLTARMSRDEMCTVSDDTCAVLWDCVMSDNSFVMMGV